MPTVKIKSRDPVVGQQREADAKRVLDQFSDSLLNCRLLCFLDDEDCQEFKFLLGAENRGFHRPINDSSTFQGWPEYLTECIFVDDRTSIWFKRVFDHVIYLHGSTCAERVGTTMTLAHELQHVVQRVHVPELLRANGLFRLLPKTLIQSVGLQWSDIPTEREVRAVAKKIAVELHGAKAVEEFLAQRVSAAKDPLELADACFIQGLDTSTPYVLKDETLGLFRRFKNYRTQFEAGIELTKSNPDYEPVDLDTFFMPPVVV
jgi:hypothetical protein